MRHAKQDRASLDESTSRRPFYDNRNPDPTPALNLCCLGKYKECSFETVHNIRASALSRHET